MYKKKLGVTLAGNNVVWSDASGDRTKFMEIPKILGIIKSYLNRE